MKLRFACLGCGRPAQVQGPIAPSWQCPTCDHIHKLHLSETDGPVRSCVLCGNHELYCKKDFPHWLGLSILTISCLAFLVAKYFYYPRLAWTILIASAAFDGLLYLWVADVIVCYRCAAHHRAVHNLEGAQPFELGVAERYRQERLRREQLQTEKKPAE